MNTPNVEFPFLEASRLGISYRFKVQLRNTFLMLRPLSIAEEDQITQEVIAEMENLSPARQTSLKQSALLAVKKLEKAQTTDYMTKDYKVSSLELSQMTPGELDYVFKQYNAHCEKLNPILEEYEPAQLKEVIEGLKKSSKDTVRTLTELSFFQLRNICLHLLTQEESREVN